MPKGMRAGVCVSAAEGAYVALACIHDGRHSLSAYGIFVCIQSVYGVFIGLCEKRAGWGRAPHPSLDGATQQDHGSLPNPNLC